MFTVIVASILTSLVPLLLGSFLATLLKKKSTLMNMLLYASSGLILALICFDLFPDVIEEAKEVSNLGILYLFIIIAITLGLMFLIHHLLEKHDPNKEHEKDPLKKFSLYKIGLFLTISLILHNFPEGMSLGVLLRNDFQSGISFGVFLAIHNLLMGVSLCLPLLISKTKTNQAYPLVFISFIPSLIGSIMGYSFLDINPIVTFIILSITIGILLFVLIEELSSIIHIKKHKILAILCFVISFLLAMIFHLVI